MNFCFRPKGPNLKVFWTYLLVVCAWDEINSLQIKSNLMYPLFRQSKKFTVTLKEIEYVVSFDSRSNVADSFSHLIQKADEM